jgi:uncharacterized protein GlcG (DUF336 family)
MRFHLNSTAMAAVVFGSAMALGAVQARTAQAACKDLPSHADLQGVLDEVVTLGGNAGLGNDMWGTIVDRDGVVCAVAFSGEDRDDQWPGSRVISAQKANTANAFSLEGAYPNPPGVGRALASGNLYGTVLEQGSLFGLQFSNPVDTSVAYGGPNAGGNANRYGQPNDPLVGQFIGGVNVFGGGLALYDAGGTLIAGLGVSGDTSCTDHIVAWKVRDGLALDNIPGGVGPNDTDNLNLAVGDVAPNSFEHPQCGFGEEDIIPTLHTVLPPGS